MLERVRKTISRYNMFGAGRRVAVAVSGGPDSVCTLLLLLELASECGLDVRVAHFNHNLRGEASDGDEKFVRDLAERLHLPFFRAEGRLAGADHNLEQAARKARSQFFAELISQGEAQVIATGHTRDDQAETVLFRLLRGTGLSGLAGILPVTREGIVRPLIEVTRADVEEFLGERGAGWREDAMNLDPQFARNRIRTSLLPQLAREWNANLGASLAQLADLAYADERWLSEMAGNELGRIAEFHRDGVEMRADEIAKLPLGLARRVVRAALGRCKGDLRRLEFDHVERILAIVFSDAGDGALHLPGVDVVRSFDWLRMSPSADRTLAGFRALKVNVPGDYRAFDGSHVRLTLETSGAAVLRPERPDRGAQNGATLKAAALDRGGESAELELRGWRAGDHYRPQGRLGDQKLAEMFQRARVPSWRRRDWPIVSMGGAIVWAKQFGPAAEFAAEGDTARVLRIVNIENNTGSSSQNG